MNPTAVLLVMVMILVVGCTNQVSPESTQPKGEIAIATELPLSDEGVMDAKNAVEAAIKGRAMVRGYRLVHKSFDDSFAGGRRERALQNAKLMVGDSQIVGVVGPWNSLSVVLAAPVAGQDNLVMISPSTTRDCLTANLADCSKDPGAAAHANNFFRLAARNVVNARIAANFAIGKLGVKRFALIAWDDRDSAVIGDAFRSELERMGGTVVFSGFYLPTDPTYAPLLNKARDSGAEAVYVVWGHTPDGTCRVRAAMNGIFPPDAYLISSDGIADQQCIVDAGGAANEHLVATVSAGLPAPAALKGISLPARSVKLAEGISPYSYAAYDCAQILIDAIDRAIAGNRGKVPTRLQVLNAVAATKDFKGLTGTFSFDANGDAIKPAVSFYNVQAGTWTFWQNAL